VNGRRRGSVGSSPPLRIHTVALSNPFGLPHESLKPEVSPDESHRSVAELLMSEFVLVVKNSYPTAGSK